MTGCEGCAIESRCDYNSSSYKVQTAKYFCPCRLCLVKGICRGTENICEDYHIFARKYDVVYMVGITSRSKPIITK